MKIAIALAAYEPKIDFFIEQLESIRHQTHRDLECFIQFDSEFESFRQDARFAKILADGRFHWNKNPARLGFKKNFEAALGQILRKSSAQAIAFSDQDDVWDLEKLERLLHVFTTLPPFSMVHSDMRVMDKNEHLMTTSAWHYEKRGVRNVDPLDLVIRNVVTGAGLLMDRKLAEQFSVIPPEFEFHDQYYAVLAASLGKVWPLDRALYTYRIHGNNVVGVKSYTSLAANPNRRSLKQIAVRVSEVWAETQARARALLQALEGIETPELKRLDHMIISDADYGASLIAYGLVKKLGMRGDDPLFRSILVNALGKIRSHLNRIVRTHEPHKKA